MSYHLFEIYPVSDPGEDKLPFFIEFIQFSKGDSIRWKLYRRNYIFPKEEYEKMKAKNPNDWTLSMMSNEGHPYWILDGTLQPDGTVPDKKWLFWMVDALNDKAKQE